MKARFIYLTLFLILFTASNVVAKSKWVNVRTPNFNLVGDASEKRIREVATKLEQFRTTFRSLFPQAKFNQTVGINVIVFKNKRSYKPFQPKRADGKADKWIAGYFQPGEDVNYITLSIGGTKEDTYGTIFHEYVHFLMDTNFGKSVVPPWFNEGLAEYYQTFQIEKNIKVKLGLPQQNHLRFLNQSKLISLRDFFKIDNRSLHASGGHSRSIFYAQAWALIHYLTLSKQNRNLSKFLNQVMNEVEPEKAFQKIFGYDYKTMEKNLRKYVRQRTFKYNISTFKQPLVFDTQMKVTPLSDAEANAYLGDLLYHTQEYEDAEVYLNKALTLDSNQTMANTSFGLLKMRQGKFDEAKKFLEKATSTGQQNHLAHYNYAYVLSRESHDEFGYVSSFPPESARKIRQSLVKSIQINSNFTASYGLLAFINYVNNEKLDQAVSYLKTALRLQPGNQQYALRIAQIYIRQSKIAEAEKLAKQLAKTAVEDDIRKGAQGILSNVKVIRENETRRAANRETRESPRLGRRDRPNVKKKSELSEEDVKNIERENTILDINQDIKRPTDGEKQVVGYIQKIDCVAKGIKYLVKTDAGVLTLRSKDFEELELFTFADGTEKLMIGCDAKVQNILMVLTYRDEKNAKRGVQGYLTAMVFVPEFFKLKTKEETAKAKHTIIVDDVERRNAMMNAIKARLRKPLAGEKRGVGFLQEIVCTRKYQVFHVKIDSEILKLKVDPSNKVKIIGYTSDMERVSLRCGSKPPPVTAVINYRLDKKSKKINGDIISLEFVPKGFSLN